MPEKKTSTRKTTSTTPKKKTTTTRKPTTKPKTTSKPKITTKPKKEPSKKPAPKKKTTTVAETSSTQVVPKKSTPRRKKPTIVTKKEVEQVFEGKTGRKRLGKLFYLIFSIVFFSGVFFYVNNFLYDNNDYTQSAIFAFAALFVVFILLNFNIHKIIFNFFVLPFKYIFREARMEIRHEIEDDPDQTGKFHKYKAIFTLILYAIVLVLLMGSQIWNGIRAGEDIVSIIFESSMTGLGFIVVICLWQYLYNIIPEILENSIDAKNGYILMLSAIVLVIYVIFIILDISYLSEMMVFLLILGFIALLGVNLNMIIGEFNIFSNLRNRDVHTKTVTRAVFLIFFSFHLYVILYGSVVAYSIYNQNNETYNFNNVEYHDQIVSDVLENGTDTVSEVFDSEGTVITSVYDIEGNKINNIELEGEYSTEYYDSNGVKINQFYKQTDLLNPITEVEHNGITYYHPESMEKEIGYPYFIFYQGGLVGVNKIEQPHSYGDMLYYSVITISSVGYGDITPNTNYVLSQFWGAFLSIYGISFYALSIGYVSNVAFMGVTEKKEKN